MLFPNYSRIFVSLLNTSKHFFNWKILSAVQKPEYNNKKWLPLSDLGEKMKSIQNNTSWVTGVLKSWGVVFTVTKM